MTTINVFNIRNTLLNTHMFGLYRGFFKNSIGYDDDGQNREYTQALENTHAILKGQTLSFSSLPGDIDIMYSIEEFIDIVSQDDEALKYISQLMDVTKGTLVPEEKNLIEEKIFLLILNHFWLLKENKNNEAFPLYEYSTDELTGKPIVVKAYRSFDDFKKAFKSKSKPKSYNWISLIDNFLKNGRSFTEKDSYVTENITNYLNCVRHMRNKITHNILEDLSEQDIYYLCYFKLFTMMATVLSMRRALGGEYEKKVNLTMSNLSEQDVILISILQNRGENANVNPIAFRLKPRQKKHCEITRYYKYSIKVDKLQGNKIIEPIYSSLSPIVTWTGKEIKYSANIDEQLFKNRKLISQHLENIEQSTENTSKNTNEIKEDTNEINNKLDELIKTLINNHKQLIAVIGLIALIVLLVYIVKTMVKSNLSPTLSPAEYVVKGDQELIMLIEGKNVEGLPPVESYRKAIEMYNDTLSKNPSDEDAHRSLAMMYMRGKGYYDIDSALLHAKSISHTDEGKGLYAYLLTKTDSLDKARLLTEEAHDNNTNYMKLAKAVLALYGSNELTRKNRTKESIREALDSLHQIPNQEARFEEIYCTLYGISDENDNSNYFVNPQPVESIYALDQLAVDSLYPIPFVELMELSQRLQHFDSSLTTGYVALSCGIWQVAPLLMLTINLYADLENESTQTVVRRIAKLSGLIENSVTLANDINRILSAKKLGKQQYQDALMLADSLIAKLEKHDTNGYEFYNVESLYKNRVRLCLITGDSVRAVSLALANSSSKDSVAMMLYLRGIKAVLDNPEDTVYSDSLISLAAERGLADAVYTRLRKTPPIQHKAKYTTTSIKKYQDHEEIEFSSNGFEMQYSPNAIIEDSIWIKYPMLATALSDYWKHDYRKQKRYINYCAQEYKDFWNVFYSIYYPTIIRGDNEGYYVEDVKPDYDEDNKEYVQINFIELSRMPDKWIRIEELTQDEFTNLLLLIDRGISHSLEAGNGLMVRYFCAVKMIVVDLYGPKYLKKPQGYVIWQKHLPFIPKEWVLEDGNIRIHMPLSLDLPVYTY